jgi:hypothetical protein
MAIAPDFENEMQFATVGLSSRKISILDIGKRGRTSLHLLAVGLISSLTKPLILLVRIKLWRRRSESAESRLPQAAYRMKMKTRYRLFLRRKSIYYAVDDINKSFTNSGFGIHALLRSRYVPISDSAE